MFSDIPVLAVIVSVIASMVLGFLWYSPFLFGSAWQRMGNLDPAKMKAFMLPAMLASVLHAAVFAWGLWYALRLLSVDTVAEAAGMSLGIWLVFSGLSAVMHRLFEQRPAAYIAIAAAHDAVNAVLTGVIVFWLGW